MQKMKRHVSTVARALIPSEKFLTSGLVADKTACGGRKGCNGGFAGADWNRKNV